MMVITPGLTAPQLVAALLAPTPHLSVVGGSEVYQGAALACGSYVGATKTTLGSAGHGLTIDAGVVLSSGTVLFAGGTGDYTNIWGAPGAGLGNPMSTGNASWDHSIGGHDRPPGSILLSPRTIPDTYSGVLAAAQGQLITQVFDAASLQFSFIPDGPRVKLRFWFTSYEYPEFVGSQFTDTFVALLNGVNIALIPGTSTIIAINTVAATKPSPLPNWIIQTVGNVSSAGNLKTWDTIGGDGIVCDKVASLADPTAASYGNRYPVVITAAVIPQTVNTLQFLIGDFFDSAFDSNVYLAQLESLVGLDQQVDGGGGAGCAVAMDDTWRLTP